MVIEMKKRNRDTRLSRVLEQTAAATRRQLENGAEACVGTDAAEIAGLLGLDRANVSKELNSLYRGGQLIKRQGKPTLYLHRETVQSRFPLLFLPTTIPAGHSMTEYLSAERPQPPLPGTQSDRLEDVIGVNGSLGEVVNRAMAAVSYPPYGLHTLITGSNGVGKLRFARTLYRYGVDIGRFPPGSEPIVFSCQDGTASSNFLISQLFGCGKGAMPGADKSRRGLVEQAAGSMLFLDGVHKLPQKVQELLVTLLEKNTFTRMGEASVPREGALMIVAATTQPPDSPAAEKLVRNFPVTVTLPDLDERTPSEIFQHLLLFFGREAASTGLTFRVHRDALICLTSAPYPGNIGEMKGVVKTTTSRAHLEFSQRGGGQVVDVGLRHIPGAVMKSVYGGGVRLADEGMNAVLRDDAVFFRPGEPVTLEARDNAPPAAPEEEFPPSLSGALDEDAVDSYIGRCVRCLQTAGSRRSSRLLSQISPQLEELVRGTLLADADSGAIAANSDLLYSLLLQLDSIVRRIQAGEPPPSRDSGSMRLSNPRQYHTATTLALAMERAFGVTLTAEDVDFTAMYLYLAARWSSACRVAVLVVLHGHAVGEGVAAVLRSLCETDGVYGISFSPEVSLDALQARAAEAAAAINRGAGVLILSDMEPLGSLHQLVTRLHNIPCETICGLTLPAMAAVVRRAVRQYYTLPALVKEAAHLPELQDSGPGGGPSAAPGSFISRIIDEILSTSLTFLNPVKAADSLLTALDGVLQDLSLGYSDVIAIKFIFHCSHMLERVIRGERLEHPKLRAFVNRHSALMLCVEKRLALPGEVFGIVIPACELAYVSEIFLPFLGEEE